ncbi:hypothetical protein [Carboxylicivirga marina]|uniref:Lipoprotein n=1 Tax=Carboxylicivirga marina TaxID=2800988 RepID=A0ABS1HFF0_9BACT|nr:hypothetical protein [Carboxylicivirga marina]MBK3515914.1 hypothetical protein [Carboxylicivirga marina]
MNHRTLLFIILLILSSCCRVLDSLLEKDYRSNCIFIEQSNLQVITPGKAVIYAKIKNTGDLVLYDIMATAELSKDGVMIEKQNVRIPSLSTGDTRPIAFHFHKILYGSEYDEVNLSLIWKSHEPSDYYDDDCDF